MKLMVPALLVISLTTSAGSALTVYKPLNERRATPPDLTYVSTRPPEQTRDCLVDQLSNMDIGFDVLPRGQGYTIKTASPPVGWFVDVDPTQDGSQVKAWNAGRFNKKLKNRLDSCA
jgi:hypothetical protein